MSKSKITIHQNILGQVTIELQMDNPCWSKLQKSVAWKEVYRILEVSQKSDIHQCRQVQVSTKEIAKKIEGDGNIEECENPIREHLIVIVASVVTTLLFRIIAGW